MLLTQFEDNHGYTCSLASGWLCGWRSGAAGCLERPAVWSGRLSACLVVWLSGCLVRMAVWSDRLSGCLAVWLSGCLACLAVWPSGLSGLSGCLVRLAVWCGRLSGAAGCLERPGVCLSPCLLCVFWFKCFTDVFCFVGLQSYPKTQGSSKQTGGPRL